jgi:sulfur relay (sulfurtransferase) DsrF/TusC family protein
VEKQEYLSPSKYAEHRNITKGYTGRLIKEGRLYLIKDKLSVAMQNRKINQMMIKLRIIGEEKRYMKKQNVRLQNWT